MTGYDMDYDLEGLYRLWKQTHVCTKCHYCYSYQPKIEQLEKRQKYTQATKCQNNYL